MMDWVKGKQMQGNVKFNRNYQEIEENLLFYFVSIPAIYPRILSIWTCQVNSAETQNLLNKIKSQLDYRIKREAALVNSLDMQ